MKNKITKRFNVLCVILCVAVAFSGCAGQEPRVESDGLKARNSGAVKPSGSAKTSELVATVKPDEGARTTGEQKIEQPRVIRDDSEKFELIKTPFGYMKRRARKVEDTPPPSSPPSAVPAPEDKGPVKPTGPPDAVLPSTATPQAAPETSERKEAATVSAPPEAAVQGIPDEKRGVTFNFDNADIYEVIRTISDILQINYMVDPGVRGTVTIRTTRGLSKKDIFPVFRQILEASGLMIVEEGAIHKIVSIKDASRMPLALRPEREAEDIAPSEQIVIQIVPLKFITAQEMTKLLTPFVSSTGAIVADTPSNTLLVVDKGINILKVLQLVNVFDINLLEKVSHRFYFLENIDAEEATKTIREISSSYPAIGQGKVNLITIKRLNAVLAITPQAEVLEKIDAFIAQLDIPSEDMGPRIYVYSVRNGEAQQLSTLLNSIFGKGGTADKKDAKEFVHPNPLAVGAGKKEPEKAEPAAPAQEAAVAGESSSVRGEIKITPDEVRNALIIEATPRDYKIVYSILERLDVLPRQVLIEATVAEITLGKGLDMGVEWTFKNEPWSKTGSLSATIGAAGLNYAIGLTEKWQAVLSALEKEDRVNILSSPHVLASDNKEAHIDISTEVPVASTEYTYTSGDSDVLSTSIQYRDTGVILRVTPHINERGLVTMDISQEVSEQSTSVSVGGKDYPSFYKRAVATTLTVKHGQTLVIGGLIKETESDSVSGVPCLVEVPLVRYLFGKDKQERSKTEMIVMITPRVIVNLEDVNAVTEEFKEKVSQVKESIEKRKDDTGRRSLLF